MSKYTFIHMPNLNLLAIKEMQFNKNTYKGKGQQRRKAQTFLVTHFRKKFLYLESLFALRIFPKTGESFVPRFSVSLLQFIKQWRTRRCIFRTKNGQRKTSLHCYWTIVAI